MANPFAIGRTHSSANSAATSMDNMLSRSRSVDENMSEADFKALSMKDRHDVTQITKDDLEYQFSIKKEDQDKKLRKEHDDWVFGELFK